ncbi:MAG: hypothetical protein HN350_17040 [Phycisphaerales bacterium]|jgi:hypothetical protein|nr:hypothetical protein [Phycisphaerales bacterium]
MWNYVESIIVLVAIGVAAAWLACRAKKTLSGQDDCACGKDVCCSATALDALDSLPDGDEAGEDTPAPADDN